MEISFPECLEKFGDYEFLRMIILLEKDGEIIELDFKDKSKSSYVSRGNPSTPELNSRGK